MRKKQIRRQRKIIKAKDCSFCKLKTNPDYKDLDNLKHFISERGKILPRTATGICQKHQLRLAKSIKAARYMALMSFVVRPS